MCGIAGTFAYAASAPPVDRAELARVRDRMHARGPDGSGEWFSANGRLGFAHRRLAIIDLSDAGLQPMHSADGRYSIVFNGEIYNYRELRTELVRKGTHFASHSDTEVLLHLYAREGEAMLARLRGMFAIALWDNAEQRLFLARDPFGIKPLYYADDGKTLRFASQVKALLEAPIDRTADPAGRVGFFIWGSVPEPYTLYRSIRALPAGSCMQVREGARPAPRMFASTATLFLDAADNPATCARTEAKEAIAAALRDTIAAHHIADVPVGAFLSSGMDSTLIAYLSPKSGDALRTVTLGFDEYAGNENDEVPLAETVARSIGTAHRTIRIKKEDFAQSRAALLEAMDQPSIDGVNTWFVSRAAAHAGLKVALSGVGGDELFASYPSFRDVPRIRRAVHRLGALATLGVPIRKLLAPMAKRVTSPKYASLLEYGLSMGGAYLLRRALYLPWELNEQQLSASDTQHGLAELDVVAALDRLVGNAPQTRTSARERMQVSALETNAYMKNQLLRDTDWTSMAHSLEVRTPLVDWKLAKDVAPFLAAHPDLTKPECYAAAAPQIASAILEKPKTGFIVPVRDWLMRGSPEQARARGLRGWAAQVQTQFGG